MTASVSSRSKALVVSTETDRGSYSQADCWLQDVELRGDYCLHQPSVEILQ